MKYVLSVKAKYLQMLVAYNIYMKKPNQVTLHFEQFNQDYGEMYLAFKEVTCQVFLAKLHLEVEPVVPHVTVRRESVLGLGLSENETTAVEQFLVSHGLQVLVKAFLRKGVTVADILVMSEEEMEKLGIKLYSLRKRLLREIKIHGEDNNDSVYVEVHRLKNIALAYIF